jgi:hypothetical protein
MSGSEEQRLFFVHWNFDGEKFSSLASLLQESKNTEKNGLRVGNLDVLHVPRRCRNQHASGRPLWPSLGGDSLAARPLDSGDGFGWTWDRERWAWVGWLIGWQVGDTGMSWTIGPLLGRQNGRPAGPVRSRQPVPIPPLFACALLGWSTSTKVVHGITGSWRIDFFSCFVYDPISLMTLRARPFNYCSADIWFYYGLAIQIIMSCLSWVVTLIVFPLFFYMQICLQFNIFNFDHRIR